MSFLFHNTNTIITSHYYLIKIISTYYKDFIFLNMCEKVIVDNLLKTKGVTILHYPLSSMYTICIELIIYIFGEKGSNINTSLFVKFIMKL